MDENLPNKIDRLFNDTLQKYKSDPSDEVWHKIEAGLDEQDKKIGWYANGWKHYAAAILLLVTVLGTLYKIKNPREIIINRQSNLKAIVPNPSVRAPELNLHDVASYTGPKIKKKELKKCGSLSSISYSNEKPNVDELSKSNQVERTEKINELNTSLLDSVSTSMHIVSTQSLQSRLSGISVQPVFLPANKIKDKSLSLTHQKILLKNRLSATAYFSQEFAGYSLTDNDLVGSHGQEIEQHERNVFSASVGFFLNYRINKRWILQSGLSYSWSNSQIDSGISYAVKDNLGNIQYKLNTISGYGYLHSSSLIQPKVGDSVSTAKSFSQLHYLTIPLILSYRIPLKRFSILVGVGGSFNVLTSAEIETKTFGNSNPEKEYTVNMMGLNKTNYGIILKLDVEYHVNSRVGLNLIPCFKNTLSPINLESAVTSYPYNFGIGLGVTLRF